jgi:hypothetical protein
MSDENTMTFAFDLTALKRLRDPQLVFADTREFAENVGIVASAGPPVVSKFVRDSGLEVDFRSGPGGLSASVLRDIAETFGTERHVLVATSNGHQMIAERAEWGYQSVDAIAKEEDWRLQYAPPERTPTEFENDGWP